MFAQTARYHSEDNLSSDFICTAGYSAFRNESSGYARKSLSANAKTRDETQRFSKNHTLEADLCHLSHLAEVQ